MKLAIGIDLGGTLIKYALVNEKGKILFYNTHSTDANISREKVIRNLESCANDALSIVKLKNMHVSGIGVGIPGVVDKGVVKGGAENLPDWENLHFEDLFRRKIGLPVCIENVRSRALKIAMKETSVFTHIEKAILGNKAGVLGAAALVFDHYGVVNI